VVENFRALYLEALAAKDYSAARCLENLGKHTGAFREHNKQKRYSAEDVEALEKKLKERGFDFSRKNCPPELNALLDARPPNRLPPPSTN
jgi:hypothetical protein